MYPTLYENTLKCQVITAFGGYRAGEQLEENQWAQMENLTSDHAPALATRACRSQADTGVEAMISKDGLCTVKNGKFYISGHETPLSLDSRPKQLIGMGAYVVILPDKKYINTVSPEDHGSIEASFTTTEPVVAELCDMDGNVYSAVSSGETAPENTDATWVDTSTQIPTVRQYAEAYSTWSAVPSVYVKLTSPGLGAKFAQYDGVSLSGFQDVHLQSLNTSAVVWNRGEDFLVVVGVIPGRVVEESPITVSRTMPEMDFVVEYQNRLWGCRYGFDSQGQVVNEIYASKQGDFKNWSCFMGIETDSYRVSCGTDGQFTGAAVVQNQPIFFKEDYMHIVYGSAMPFQVQAVRCRGVQAGCDRSLAVSDEVLYYKSREGICAYSGSLPNLVSEKLGAKAYRNAVGGTWNGKYYVSMESDGYDLFVLDTRRGLWHREDSLQVRQFCESGGNLYGALPDGTLLVMNGQPGQWENNLPFLAESGIWQLGTPGQKYLHSLLLRLKLEGELTVEVCCDDGQWEAQYTLYPGGIRSYELPIHPKRCDHFRIRLRGRGQLKLYSITKFLEVGSEKP